jgi:hypothetical protein
MSETRSGTTVFGKKFGIASLSFIAMLVIGDIDYLNGYQISMLVVYILPIGIATIYVGPAFAALLAILSVAIAMCSSYWAGMPQSWIWALFWNASIALVVFLIAIGLLQSWKRSLLGASER